MEVSSKAQKQETQAVLKGNESVSLERFFEQYNNLEDGWKYEWNDGQIEKTKGMNQIQTAILIRLIRLFYHTDAFQKGGCLVSETDVYTSERQLRKPDISFFSGEQFLKLETEKNQVPAWVAEVISETDNANKIGKKNVEYFNAGVKVVWQIYPELRQVHVYTASDKVTICQGKTVCSGAPILTDFTITADELFGDKRQ